MVRPAFENFCPGHSKAKCLDKSGAGESNGLGGLLCGKDGENPEMFRR